MLIFFISAKSIIDVLDFCAALVYKYWIMTKPREPITESLPITDSFGLPQPSVEDTKPYQRTEEEKDKTILRDVPADGQLASIVAKQLDEARRKIISLEKDLSTVKAENEVLSQALGTIAATAEIAEAHKEIAGLSSDHPAA